MKKVLCALLALTCLLGLTACQSGGEAESKASWTADHAREILSAGACSEELEELDMDTAWMLFKLADYGLERECLTDGAYHRSAGGTCEEVAVLIFEDEQSAAAAAEALGDYVAAQIKANADYRPDDIPKLENAWLEQRGNTLLLAVVNELESAQSAAGK